MAEPEIVMLARALCAAAQESGQDEKFVRVWAWADAPQEFRDLSRHGGDEDWIAFVPAGLASGYFGWMEDGSPFGCCSVSIHELPGGAQVRIGAHA